MRIKEFKARIKNIEYKEFDAKSSFAKEPKNYTAQCLICENHQGRQKHEIRHNITFYMSKEDFEKQTLEVGDIVLVRDGVQFLPSLASWNTYDPKKLEKIPANKIRTDEKGRPYSPQKGYCYKLSAKINQWQIDRKNTELYYWQLGRLKIFMANEEEMFDEQTYAFYLEQKEYEKVKEVIEKENQTMNGYKYNSLVKKQPIKLTLEEKIDIGKWKCVIDKLEGTEDVKN